MLWLLISTVIGSLAIQNAQELLEQSLKNNSVQMFENAAKNGYNSDDESKYAVNWEAFLTWSK
jgi:hypothetical protein